MNKELKNYYLGDGVYADWDGQGIKLRTMRDFQESLPANEFNQIEHYIVLDSECMLGLDRFATLIKEQLAKFDPVETHEHMYNNATEECIICKKPKYEIHLTEDDKDSNNQSHQE